MATRLDVVIVSYECRPLLLGCLRSLREHPPVGGCRLVVVDNGSGDGTAEAVRDEFPEVDLVALGENRGFSAANNVGIRRGAAPYVLVLNPDTRVTAGALDALLELMDARRDVGVVGPRLEREDGSFDHASRRSFPTIAGALGHFTGLGRRPGAHPVLAQYRAPDVDGGRVDAVNGAFMLMRREAAEAVGLFDEGYWLYMEDLDLCYRLAEAGWACWYEPGVTVVHLKHGSSGDHRRPRVNVAFHYGMYRFYRRHYAPRRNPLVNVTVYCGIAVKLSLSLARSAVARRILHA